MTTHVDLIRSATQTLIDHVDELTALDSAIGDGDHGLNMRRGALAIQGVLGDLGGQRLNDALRTMGLLCMSTIGGSSGTPGGPPGSPPDLRLRGWGAHRHLAVGGRDAGRCA